MNPGRMTGRAEERAMTLVDRSRTAVTDERIDPALWPDVARVPLPAPGTRVAIPGTPLHSPLPCYTQACSQPSLIAASRLPRPGCVAPSGPSATSDAIA